MASTKLSTSNGNLDYTSATTNTPEHAIGTFMMPATGKWYFEVTPTSFNAANASCRIGILRNGNTSDFDGNMIVYNATGNFETYNVTDPAPNTYTQGDIIGVAINFDADTVTFYKNNVSEGSQSFGASDQFVPYVRFYVTSGTMSGVANFGQRAFAYTAPSGFKALVDTSLPTPVVAKPNTVFDAVPYTGSSGSQNIATNFSPDFVWVKTRNASTDHELYDVIRGAGVRLSSNNTLVENNLGGNGLTSFNSNGFTVPSTANYGINGSGYTYAAWAWDAGTSTVTNTAGSITSQVRANPSAGFSVVTYTGTGSSGTIGHGLGVKPKVVLIKNRDAAADWGFYYDFVDGTMDRLLLNTTDAKTDQAVSAPTSTVFSTAGGSGDGANGQKYVAYVFSSVSGYSSFGSYTGNGSASGDGPFIYLGFRPRWILFKRTNSSNNWFVLDTARDTYNALTSYLSPDLSSAEATASNIADAVSNGFKLRGNSTYYGFNGSGDTYIYAAFAESPFQYARAR
jgi:hypothetical protein